MLVDGLESDVVPLVRELAPQRACLSIPTRPCGVRAGKPVAPWPYEILGDVEDAPVRTAEELLAVLAVHPIRESAVPPEIVNKLINDGAIRREGLFLRSR
jgi:hypothetical protein